MYQSNQIQDNSHYMYQYNYNADKFEIRYIDTIEKGQGGPSTGYVMINGQVIDEYRFGGPPLISSTEMIAPLLESNGYFKLARIKLDSLDVEVFGKPEKLILLKEVVGDNVFYIRNLGDISILNNGDKSVLEFVHLP